MKYFIPLLLLSMNSAFAMNNSSIYGWDIKCVGNGGLTVQAYQSDDDFYMTYHFNGKKKIEGWADTSNQWNIDLKELMFQTVKIGDMEDINMSLYIKRNNINQKTRGTGIVNIDGEIHQLNCFIRAGIDEDDYDKISREKFPRIDPPKI